MNVYQRVGEHRELKSPASYGLDLHGGLFAAWWTFCQWLSLTHREHREYHPFQGPTSWTGMKCPFDIIGFHLCYVHLFTGNPCKPPFQLVKSVMFMCMLLTTGYLPFSAHFCGYLWINPSPILQKTKLFETPHLQMPQL